MSRLITVLDLQLCQDVRFKHFTIFTKDLPRYKTDQYQLGAFNCHHFELSGCLSNGV